MLFKQAKDHALRHSLFPQTALHDSKHRQLQNTIILCVKQLSQYGNGNGKSNSIIRRQELIVNAQQPGISKSQTFNARETGFPSLQYTMICQARNRCFQLINDKKFCQNIIITITSNIPSNFCHSKIMGWLSWNSKSMLHHWPHRIMVILIVLFFIF